MGNINKNMISLLLIIIFSASVFAQWSWQNPLPQGNVLYDIQFLDSLNGWSCGNFGTVLKTADGGKKWTLLETPSKDLFIRLFFINKNKGFVCSYDKQTFFTYDGGVSWDTVKQLKNHYITQLQFLNEKTGYALLTDSTYSNTSIYKTSDGGFSWNIYNPYPSYWLSSTFFFLDENCGWITIGGDFARTTDGGRTWQSAPVPGYQTGVTKIQFINKQQGFFVGRAVDPFSINYNSVFAVTNDGGETWNARMMPDKYAALTDVHFVSDQVGFVTTNDYPHGRIFYTENAGADWEILPVTANKFSFFGGIKAWGLDAQNIICYTADGWRTSVIQTPSVTPLSLYSVSALDTNNIAAAGKFSTIILTSDGGKTWQKSYSADNDSVSIESVFYKNKREIWAVGNSATVFCSTDNGNSWNRTRIETPSWLSDITFIDDTTGFILCFRNNSGIIYKSKRLLDKSSLIWQIANQFPFEIAKIKFTKEGIGYIAGKNKLLKSADKGVTWNELKIPIETYFMTLDAEDNYVWTAAGNKILMSTDTGNTWNIYKAFEFPGPYSSFSNVNALSFADKLNGAMGLDGRIIRTEDGGISWKEDKQITKLFFRSMEFMDKNHAWAVGDGGMILNYDSHLTNVYDFQSPKINSYNMDQNYPNPFNSQTIIKYRIIRTGMVSLKVYDILGHEIADLVNETKSPGTYIVNFDAGRYKLGSGVYLYRIQAADFSISKKLIFLK